MLLEHLRQPPSRANREPSLPQTFQFNHSLRNVHHPEGSFPLSAGALESLSCEHAFSDSATLQAL